MVRQLPLTVIAALLVLAGSISAKRSSMPADDRWNAQHIGALPPVTLVLSFPQLRQNLLFLRLAGPLSKSWSRQSSERKILMTGHYTNPHNE